jgi:hypothetical protein
LECDPHHRPDGIRHPTRSIIVTSSNTLPIPAIGRDTLASEPILAAKVAAEYQKTAALLRDRALRSSDKGRAARLIVAASQHYAEARSIMGAV